QKWAVARGIKRRRRARRRPWGGGGGRCRQAWGLRRAWRWGNRQRGSGRRVFRNRIYILLLSPLWLEEERLLRFGQGSRVDFPTKRLLALGRNLRGTSIGTLFVVRIALA